MKVLWSPIYCKIEGNYFKDKIWALYKLKTKACGKGEEIKVLFIYVRTLSRHFCHSISAHTTKNVSLTLSVTV